MNGEKAISPFFQRLWVAVAEGRVSVEHFGLQSHLGNIGVKGLHFSRLI